MTGMTGAFIYGLLSKTKSTNYNIDTLLVLPKYRVMK